MTDDEAGNLADDMRRDEADRERTALGPSDATPLFAALAEALRNRSMKISDLYGRGGTAEFNQRILLRSEILRDLSVALSDAANGA
jgi:hypothetical protein